MMWEKENTRNSQYINVRRVEFVAEKNETHVEVQRVTDGKNIYHMY
jgi:ribosomal protein L18E